MEANRGLEIFEYMYQHAMLIGWPTIIFFVWRISKFVTRTTDIAVKAVTQVDMMATEHFPAMKASLTKQDGHLESMDTSLKTMVARMDVPAQFATAQTAVRRRKR